MSYDCFYASVFEHENPALKALPLVVQQKGLAVTCNYEARRRGLSKMRPIGEARKICPDVVILLGEDLTPFRDASKKLYNFLQEYTWSKRVERLGFDEVFMDVTDMIDFNVELINLNDPCNSYFHLSRTDPTTGFAYDAFHLPGHTYPPTTSELPISASASPGSSRDSPLYIRLVLASHLAKHLRHKLGAEKGYTCSVGISTSKLLAKLAGETNKPDAQTTILPPYEPSANFRESNVTGFLDALEVGRIPGIGSKLAQKLRNHVLGQQASSTTGHADGETKEKVLVHHVRCFPSIGPEVLEDVLGGPGVPQGIGGKVWRLLNGVDDTEVVLARKVPKQISIEDSYRRLDTLEEVKKELDLLAQSLIRRMHADLLENDDGDAGNDDTTPTSDGQPAEATTGVPISQTPKKRWIAHPRTLRLSTLPRHLPNADNTSSRPSGRTSRSCPTPPFLLSLTHPTSHLAAKLVSEALLPLFRKLHPKKSGWDLSIVNVAVVNMMEVAGGDGSSSGGGGEGRDIGKMFRKQEDVLRPWKVEDRDVPPSPPKTGLD
ncbi:hypothetical protein FGG08_003106 [Glutinoglossum americanum]|uniref:UmuC domain-containing protein n=1 Tax=Glutinoglossum americanum TaxID=1670608 RepID=A0A9P8L3Y5_9PEZI|nr:hypothetical protein FGG08_003106 [Glutinoglossum americanum]